MGIPPLPPPCPRMGMRHNEPCAENCASIRIRKAKVAFFAIRVCVCVPKVCLRTESGLRTWYPSLLLRMQTHTASPLPLLLFPLLLPPLGGGMDRRRRRPAWTQIHQLNGLLFSSRFTTGFLFCSNLLGGNKNICRNPFRRWMYGWHSRLGGSDLNAYVNTVR